MPCRSRDESGVAKTRLLIEKRVAVQRCGTASRCQQNRVASSHIPFHGRPEPRIEIGFALGYQAEFQGTAGGDPFDDAGFVQKGFGVGVTVGATDHRRQPPCRGRPDLDGRHLAIGIAHVGAEVLCPPPGALAGWRQKPHRGAALRC